MWWHIHFDCIIFHLFPSGRNENSEIQTDNVRRVLVYKTLNY